MRTFLATPREDLTVKEVHNPLPSPLSLVSKRYIIAPKARHSDVANLGKLTDESFKFK
jgi:hypothetical protein